MASKPAKASAPANPWLHVIGIGEDGAAGLRADALDALAGAEVIIGGSRHHKLQPELAAERIEWPSPFRQAIGQVLGLRGRQVAVLVSGDPLWYSAGALLQRHVPVEEIRYYPQLSAFQWAAVRMGWSLADVETVTVHGRAAEQIIPHFGPGVRLLVLTRDGDSPKEIAQLLKARGFAQSRLTVLAALGGPKEKRIDGVAAKWRRKAPDFHLLAVECVADMGAEAFSRTGGLPDHAFAHDGQMTKRVVRAATLSALLPYPDALLWDIGAGCGSISVEWMRAARGAMAIAIEPDGKRRGLIERNRLALGVPKLRIVAGEAPGALKGLPQPDAVFIGGGLTDGKVFETAWKALRGGGRLVANGVTLESEARLVALCEKHGGTLERIAASEAVAIGRYRAMKPLMAVTQWTVIKGTVAKGASEARS
ncbi:MAG: precorrin-6y C5,15-methyltransferase (decarboxylating) subunit CbiE [Nitratireductor sp.]|nr:precorrin-6y C5,15-methyltransferase (decarboxylating) subunit CbiE [Nitratireductor sp.]